MEREAMEFDVVIVGGGPAGLAVGDSPEAAGSEKGSELSVCLIEKGAEIGAHILSGAVMDPRALTELLPNWKEDGAPLNAPVSEDRFFILSETGADPVPNSLLPLLP
jgi:electron-transferring-flavoprotein dehydrogenase